MTFSQQIPFGGPLEKCRAEFLRSELLGADEMGRAIDEIAIDSMRETLDVLFFSCRVIQSEETIRRKFPHKIFG